MRWVTDDAGRRWCVERVGRTSGMIPPKKSTTTFPEPADIVRFSCESESPPKRPRHSTPTIPPLWQYHHPVCKEGRNAAAPLGVLVTYRGRGVAQ
jgi:hypothetical protein